MGLFILNKLENLFPQKFIGLYRDNGLAVTDLPGPYLDRLWKEDTDIFNVLNLKITVETGVTDFLDTFLNLSTST